MGAFDVIQNVTFLGAAIDRPDRHKNVNKIMAVFNQVVSGRIKNVYTRKDWVLAALYSGCEMDQAMGRCPVFTEQFFLNAGMTSTVRANLFGHIREIEPLSDYLKQDEENDDEIVHIVRTVSTEDSLRAVAEQGEVVFRLQNYDIWSLKSNFFLFGIGHMGYRENLDIILEFIDF